LAYKTDKIIKEGRVFKPVYKRLFEPSSLVKPVFTPGGYTANNNNRNNKTDHKHNDPHTLLLVNQVLLF
jgi:hypothetical protein